MINVEMAFILVTHLYTHQDHSSGLTEWPHGGYGLLVSSSRSSIYKYCIVNTLFTSIKIGYETKKTFSIPLGTL